LKEILGGICAVPGVRACGARRGKYGVALIAASGEAAGVFTANRVKAAPLEVTANNLAAGWLDGVIANSGCANAYTGKQGIKDAKSMADVLASILRTDRQRIAVASTGVIGRYLDLDMIQILANEAKERLRNSPDASGEAASAIMTTDTRIKEVAVEHKGFRVAGLCKGAGMIAPNMATMLAFLYTDANIEHDDLASCLAKAVDDSFNMLTVDGDMSTNDMALITATGTADAETADFQEALDHVCISLARKMAKDGEGATKYMEVLVEGALSREDARLAAKAIAGSSLVKTALYGADPNWGRIVCAAGRSGAEMEPSMVTLSIAGNGKTVALVRRGKILLDSLGPAKEVMQGEDVLITLDLGLGGYSARSFGCDLTHGYVDINAKYTT
jgi:glutamate N-acetyltransferase/amino-acid N-acetyltransferase